MSDIKNELINADEVMAECEEYRETLVFYCQSYFGCEREYAEDCVQEAFVALYTALLSGNKIGNYKSWLYKVVLNKKNDAVKEIVKRNEYKKSAEISALGVYNPYFADGVLTDGDVYEYALRIISDLSDSDRELYTAYYKNNKKLKEFAEEKGVSYTSVRKQHAKLKITIRNEIKKILG